MTNYPLHNESHEIHPKSGNVKKCPYCQGTECLPLISSDFKKHTSVSIKNKELIIKFLDDGQEYKIVADIDKCPKCGRKL